MHTYYIFLHIPEKNDEQKLSFNDEGRVKASSNYTFL